LFQTGDILEYFEDLKQGANKDIGPKGNFEMGSTQIKQGGMRMFTERCECIQPAMNYC